MLIGVTTCLDYSSYLKKTLHNNIKYFDKFYVITSEKDTDTIDLCNSVKKVSLIKTEVFFDKNAPFYKSKALNQVLDSLSKEEDVWCAILDADVLLPDTFKQVNLKDLDKDCIFSYKRNVGNHHVNGFVLGYFQLFNTKSLYYNFNYDLMFRTAHGSDIIFSMQWPKNNNILFEQDEIKHISLPNKDWCGVKNNENEREKRIQNFIKEIKNFVNDIFNKNIDEKDLIHKYVETIQRMKGGIFQRELNIFRDFAVRTENIKNRLTRLKTLKTKLSLNNESVKEDIKQFIDNQKTFLDKIQTEINTHNTCVQELSEILKHLDC